MKIKITYDPIVGVVMPDALVNRWIDGLCTLTEDVSVCIGSELILHELRARHAEGRLTLDSTIEYVFPDGLERDYVTLNEYGRIDRWPPGFADYSEKALERLLTAASRLRKERKQKHADSA